MEIMAQAAIGLSRFLHPDYVSATPMPQYYYERMPNLRDLLGKIYAITVVVILVILFANFLTIVVKRYLR